MKKLLCCLVLVLSFSAIADTSTFTPDQTKAIENIMRQYLVTHPQVLVEANQALKQKITKEAQALVAKGIEANKKELFYDQMSPVIGKSNAAYTLVEFLDYQCPHSRAMLKVISQLLNSHQNVKVIYKELPIYGANSELAATAALAANQQGKFNVFHQALMAAPLPLSKNAIFTIAERLGLNVEQLKHDMKNASVNTEIKGNYRLASALQLMGTPAFVLTNKDESRIKFFPGPVDLKTLEAFIK